ncbi:hypothetical protein PG995_001824 [Apiospora arundinis]
MSPTIHIVRHGEAEHNVGYDLSIRDPGLTARGGMQCQSLAASFPYKDQISLLVASPLRRTVQTAHWAFAAGAATTDASSDAASEERKEKQRQRVIVGLGELQECSAYPCDVGRSVEELSVSGALLDLSRVEPAWNSKQNLYGVTEDAVRARVRRARHILRELAAACVAKGENDAHIVVVSHGTLIQYLIERPDARRKNFDNCEYRSYKFVDLHGKDPSTAGLVETNESFYRRNGPLNMRSPKEADDLLAAEVRRG